MPATSSVSLGACRARPSVLDRSTRFARQDGWPATVVESTALKQVCDRGSRSTSMVAGSLTSVVTCRAGCAQRRRRYDHPMPWSVAQRPLTVPITSIEQIVLEELDVVRVASDRLRVARGPAFDPIGDVPRLGSRFSPVLEIPRVALSITVAAVLDADVRWGVGRIRGLVFELVERVDAEARRAGWI